jgi:hypothetical protein
VRQEFFADPRNTDPSHSLLAKDHFDHPLNTLAGKCAQYAILHTAGVFMHVIQGRRTPADLIQTATGYFVHPEMINEHDHHRKKLLEIIDRGIKKKPELLDKLTFEAAKSATTTMF